LSFFKSQTKIIKQVDFERALVWIFDENLDFEFEFSQSTLDRIAIGVHKQEYFQATTLDEVFCIFLFPETTVRIARRLIYPDFCRFVEVPKL
jgi:hypothetical protein